MHVLYFHQHFTTTAGASGTRSYEMAQRLLEKGHRVTMVCGSFTSGQTGLTSEPVRGRRRGMVDGIDVIELCLPYANRDGFIRRSLTFLRFALRSIGIAFTERPDLIFATSTPLTVGIPGILARWLRGTPFVFEVRDLWPELPREMGVIKNPAILGMLSLLEWISYHSADACVALAPGIADGIRRRGVSNDRISTVPNGCDLALFQPQDGESGLPGVLPGDFLALFAGAHGQANGLDVVVDAGRVLSSRGRTDIKIVLIGDGKLKPALRARAEAAGTSNVIFLDPIPKVALAQALGAADAGLMILANVPAFYYGTSPNKFFDYIASGLPIVNNYPGWLADMITEHACGIVVPPEAPESLAIALERLADDRLAAREMGNRSRRLAESGFSRDVLGTNWVAVLERVQAARAGKPVQVSSSESRQTQDQGN